MDAVLRHSISQSGAAAGSVTSLYHMVIFNHTVKLATWLC